MRIHGTMKDTSRRTIFWLMFSLAALVLLAASAPAQEFDRSAFYLNGIRPAVESLNPSVILEGLGNVWANGPDSYEMGAQPGDMLSLRRSFNRTVVDYIGTPLRVAVQESLATEAKIDLSDHTGLSFASTTTKLSDVRGFALGETKSEVMGLAQTFGKGDAATAMGFTRTTTQQTPLMGLATESVTETVDLHTGLTGSSDFALKARRTSNDVVTALQETDIQGALTLHFSGGDTPIAYAKNHRLLDGQDVLTRKLDFALPFSYNKQKILAERHESFTSTNGVGVDSATSRLVLPFQLDGKLFTAEESLVEVRQPGVAVDTQLTKLLAPVAGGQAVIQRQVITTEVAAAATQTEQEQLAIILPTIKVNDRMSVTGQRLSTEVPGVMDTDVTNVSVTAKPVEPLEVQARYSLNDPGPLQQATTSRQLYTKWALDDHTAVMGQLSEAEVVGAAPNVLRLVELVRDRGTSNYGLRAGFASYEAANMDIEAARRFEFTAGKPSSLDLKATYSEYDPNSFVRFAPDAALIAIALQHGDPSDLAIRCRYEDQPTRLEPLRAVELATEALGGSLQVSYQTNPVAPDGYTMRAASQYDATLGRKIFGAVDLKLGYRYLEYDEVEATDQHMRIELAGGTESRGGCISLKYSNGDFCALPGTPANPLTPGSMLDLNYARSFGDSARLRLWLQRQTAPQNTTLDGSTEGGLEASLAF